MVNRNMYNTSLWLLHIHVSLSLLLMFEKRRLKQLSFDFTWEICHLLDITAVAGHLAWLAVLFHCELNHLSTSMYRQWVPCERNSSYNFIPIFLKLCTCFLHSLKMCMWFECNPCINFCHFFHFVNLSFSDLRFYESVTVGTLWAQLLVQFYTIFLKICSFSMVWRCACGLDVILALSFVTFSTLRTLSFSDLRFYESVVTVGNLWAQLLIQFYTDLLFFTGLKMCMWFWFNPAVNFCHFSNLLTSSFFAGVTSTSPKFDLLLILLNLRSYKSPFNPHYPK